MRLILQRVKQASVKTGGQTVGEIGQGILALFGVRRGDSDKQIPWLANKLAELRMFPDSSEKMNLNLREAGGGILIVSQFTLYADCSKGRRPTFIDAMEGKEAERLYETFVSTVRRFADRVETGVFGAQMEVSLINDGPATFIIDSKD